MGLMLRKLVDGGSATGEKYWGDEKAEEQQREMVELPSVAPPEGWA